MDPAIVNMAPKKSRRTLWVIIGIVIVILIGISAVIYSLQDASKPAAVTSDASTTAVTETVASKDEVKQNLADADESIKQAATDQAAAKDAQNEGDSQIKVGN